MRPMPKFASFSSSARSFICIENDVGLRQSPCYTPIGQSKYSVSSPSNTTVDLSIVSDTSSNSICRRISSCGTELFLLSLLTLLQTPPFFTNFVIKFIIKCHIWFLFKPRKELRDVCVPSLQNFILLP